MDPGERRVSVFGEKSDKFHGLFHEVGNDGGILDLHP
jgi:hypothetical protein